MQLPKGFFFRDQSTGQRVGRLSGLSRINIFVGENNSGKSRLIRQIAGSNELNYRSLRYPLDSINEAIKLIKEQASAYIKSVGIPPEDDFMMLSAIPVDEYLKEGVDSAVKGFQGFWQECEKRKATMSNRGWQVRGRDIRASDLAKEFQNIVDAVSRKVLNIEGSRLSELGQNQTFRRIYLPIIRGLRPFQGFTDVFEQRTIEDYFQGANKNLEIFTGLKAFQIVKDHLLGDLAKRKKIGAFEKYISAHFFDSKPVSRHCQKFCV